LLRHMRLDLQATDAKGSCETHNIHSELFRAQIVPKSILCLLPMY